jgi:hypothetical protein
MARSINFKKTTDLVKMIQATEGFTVDGGGAVYKVHGPNGSTSIPGHSHRLDSGPRKLQNLLTSLKRIGWTPELYAEQMEKEQQARKTETDAKLERKNNARLESIAATQGNQIAGEEADETVTDLDDIDEDFFGQDNSSPIDFGPVFDDDTIDRIELLPFVGPIPTEVLRHVAQLGGELANKTFYLDRIDPPKATRYIQQAVGYNRSVQMYHADTISEDMKKGTFLFNGASVLVDEDGRLNDGQHRMVATTKAGDDLHHPWWGLFVSGISREVFKTVDRSASRNFTHVLQTFDIKNANLVAPVVRRVLSWERGKKYFRNNAMVMTHTDLLTRVGADRELFDWASGLMASQKSFVRQNNMNSYAWGFLLFMCAKQASPEFSEEFWVTNFAKGQKVETEKHPSYVLRRRLLKNTKKVDSAIGGKKVVEFDYNDYVAYGLTAWNNWVQGTYTTTLRSPSDGWKPDDFNAMTIASL